MSTENNTNPEPELAVDLLQYGTLNPDRKKGFNVSSENGNSLNQDPEVIDRAWDALAPEEKSVIAHAAPLIDQVLDNPVMQQHIEAQGLQKNEELLASFRSLVGSSDTKVFRSQVIRAFKHLGLDTVKFFGE